MRHHGHLVNTTRCNICNEVHRGIVKAKQLLRPGKVCFRRLQTHTTSEDDKKHGSPSDTDRRKFGIKQVDENLITTAKIS